jgi:hypothetical protein
MSPVILAGVLRTADYPASMVGTTSSAQHPGAALSPGHHAAVWVLARQTLE